MKKLEEVSNVLSSYLYYFVLMYIYVIYNKKMNIFEKVLQDTVKDLIMKQKKKKSFPMKVVRFLYDYTFII